MKVIFCAYREWATNVIDSLPKYYDYIELDDTSDIHKRIIEYKPDVIFFIGWSSIIPEDIVNNYLCLCIHPSRLPKYRGGSPIQNQIIDGLTSSAVTLFKMNNKIDAGDIVGQETISLSGDLEEILERITEASITLIVKTLVKINLGIKLDLIQQEESVATYCKRRKPSDSEITIEDLENKTAIELYNKVRCLQDPYPNAYIKLGNGDKLYILNTKYDA